MTARHPPFELPTPGPDPLQLAPSTCSGDELVAAVRHLEDLEIFVGQRSRLHPGAGWALTLAVLREQLGMLRDEQRARGLGGTGS